MSIATTLLAPLLLLAAGEARLRLSDGTELRGEVVRAAADGAPLLLRIGGAVYAVPARAIGEMEAEEPAPADSPAPPPDIVTLRDGGLVGGRLLAEDPDAVRIEARGRVLSIPRAKVVSVERAGAAGPARGPAGGADGTLARLAESLRLSEEQKPKVREALAAMTKAISDARASAGADREASISAFRAAREAFRARMAEILTDVQLRKFDETFAPRRGD